MAKSKSQQMTHNLKKNGRRVPTSPRRREQQESAREDEKCYEEFEHQQQEEIDSKSSPLRNMKVIEAIKSTVVVQEEEKPKMTRSLSEIGKFTMITESPTNKMVSTGVMLFEKSERMNDEILKKIIQKRVVEKYSRFRSTVSEDDSLFIDMGNDFNIDNHFRVAHLNYYLHTSEHDIKHRSIEDLEEEGLRELMSTIVAQPLNRNLPLWEMVTIDNYSKGFLALFRIHHCIGDGTSISTMIGEICDNPTTVEQFKTLKQKLSGSESKKLLMKLRLIRWIASALLLVTFVIGLFRILIKWTRETFKGRDPLTRYKGELGEEKSAGFECRKIKISDMKLVGQRFNSTINDIVMSCFAGALDRYCKAKGDTVERRDIRISIPVNIRTNMHEMLTPSNKFGFIVCHLPLGISDPTTRLKWVKKHMDYNKKLPEQYFSYYVGLICSKYLPPAFIKQTFQFLSTHQTAVLTNVRGSDTMLTMNGAKILDLTAFAPQPLGVGVGCAVCSYAGWLNITVIGDTNLVPDAHEISHYFVSEFQTLDQMSKAATYESF